MEQPWWIYGSIALGCALLFLVVKVVEYKVMKDGEGLEFLSFGIGLIGLFAAFQAAEGLKLFG